MVVVDGHGGGGVGGGGGCGCGIKRGFVISFLHFMPVSEYVRDISSGKVLLQNKNGNADWVYIYQMETRHLNHYVQWY
jgi:hypothetical protein